VVWRKGGPSARCTWWTWPPAWPGSWASPRPKGLTAAFWRG